MDGFGDVYLLTDQEPQTLTSPPNLGWDIAKDLTLFRDEKAFCILDGFGNIISKGRVPSLSGFPFRWNTAKSFEFLPSERATRLIAPSAQTSVSLVPQSVHLPEWQDWVSLNIHVENLFLLDEFDFSVEYDPAVLQPLSSNPVEPGEMLQPFLDETRLLYSVERPGTMTVKSVHFKDEGGPWLTGSGVLVSLRFAPRSAGSSEVKIHGFRGTDSRTHGSSWRLQDPPAAKVIVTSRRTTARVQRKPTTRRPPNVLRNTANQQSAVAQVMLLDATDVHGVRLDVEFDSKNLRITSIREGPLLSNHGTTVTVFAPISEARASGQLPDLGVSLLGRNVSAKGTGCVLELQLTGATGSPGFVRLKRLQVFDRKGIVKDIEITNSVVEIVP